MAAMFRIAKLQPWCRIFAGAILLCGTWLLHAQEQIQTGYSLVTANAGSRAPVGSALFSFTNSSGVLVSQAGVGSMEPIQAGRVFVDAAGTQTGLALVNPSSQSASLRLTLRDSSGREAAQILDVLSPRQHASRYVHEIFPNQVPAGFVGTLSFQSDQPLGAIALREGLNRYKEPLYATLPVSNPVDTGRAEEAVFPHLAIGSGYVTQIILVNPTSQRLEGKVQLRDSQGRPLPATINGSAVSEFAYQIERDGAYRTQLDSASGLQVGYAVLTPDPGSVSPVGTVIFQFRNSGELATEAAVAATARTTLSRIFVDHAGSRTGVAIANPNSAPAELTLVLMDRYGGAEATARRTVPAGGHLAAFAQEFFPETLTEGFTGLMEIQSSVPVSPITLKLTTTARNETVLTTLPVADLTRTSAATSVIFPHIVIGGAFTTRLVFINTDRAIAASGQLGFWRSDGMVWPTTLGIQSGSTFNYSVTASGGRQFWPGHTTQAASVVLVDPSSDQASIEIAVNEGGTVRPRVRVLDNRGTLRDDFDLLIRSLDTTVADVDSTGSIQGKRAGFSTLTLSAGGVISTATATVVKVDSAAGGIGVTGIAQDAGRRLYLAATSEHTILTAQDLSMRPDIYAGISGTPGFLNDLRRQALFRGPAFVAFNQAEGSLYVTDGANHAIRRIRPGASGRVETLSGTNEPGMQDGSSSQARFNNPGGIALDAFGNLWVADTGNHTIRRINLARGIVETIAGAAGNPGSADGRGVNARFNSPGGIAVEIETTAQQLERQRLRQLPPPVRVIVADTGNGVIRRVTEDGQVETLGTGSAVVSAVGTTTAKSAESSAVAPFRFKSPLGVASDSVGNIYVTESSSGLLKVIVQNRDVAVAAQAHTFSAPRGIAIAETGRVLIGDNQRSALELRYGEPAISSIAPNRINNRGGERITIKGNNFGTDTIVIAAGTRITNAVVSDSQTISFQASALPSGVTTVTVQNRGGLAQTSLLVDPLPLSALLPGQITTVAGGTTFIGDGSAAKNARMGFPSRVAFDSAGNLYIADTYNNRIRRLDARSGLITTIAGTGEYCCVAGGELATTARLSNPFGIAVDPAGNILFSESGGIRRINSKTGIIATISGTAELSAPKGIAVDEAGNLFVTDFGNRLVKKIDAATQAITIVAGTGREGFAGDGGPASQAELAFPSDVAVDVEGNLFIADLNRVRRVDGQGRITTVAGQISTPPDCETVGDDGPALSAYFNGSTHGLGIGIDASGNLIIADSGNSRVRKVDKTTQIITTLAGSSCRSGFAGEGIPARQAILSAPYAAVSDAAGNVFVVDRDNNRIRKIDVRTGIIATAAGAGQADSFGDGGPATVASLNFPEGVAVAPSGSIFVADVFVVRRVDPAGIITTVAGGSGQTSLGEHLDLALDAAGNLYIADGPRIRRLNNAGTVTDVATLADSGAAAGMAFDGSGNLYISDNNNHRIIRVDAATGTSRVIAGNGRGGFSGDGALAVTASLNYPQGIAIDANANVFIADMVNARIRRVDASSGIISTIAGNDRIEFSGDGGLAKDASLVRPVSLVFDNAGNLFVADYGKVRRITPSGIITTVAGEYAIGYGFGGDNGPATEARIDATRLAVDRLGNLYISDRLNHRVRAVRAPIP